MAGRRHLMDRVGAEYESTAHALLTPLASLVPVPRQDDFGIDSYCHVRASTGRHTETVSHLAALQVKGGEAGLTYGGLDASGEWKKHEIAWLMSLSVPLYVLHIPQDRRAVAMYSLGPVWHRFMAQTVYPFEISCVTRPTCDDTNWQLAEPTSSAASDRGDGRRWVIDLGPPLLQVSVDDASDPGKPREPVLRAPALDRSRPTECDALSTRSAGRDVHHELENKLAGRSSQSHRATLEHAPR